MASVPRNHHYVPEMLVRNFATAAGRVFYHDKGKPELGIQERNPNKILHAPHLYSTTDINGQRDASQELAYARLESDAAPIFQKVIAAVRGHSLPGLSRAEKACVDAFLFEQWRRVPEVRNHLMDEQDMQGLLDDAIAAFEKRSGRPPAAEAIAPWSDPAYRARILQNATVTSLGRRSPTVMSVLKGRGLAMVLAPPGKSFILGSRPVVKLCPPETNDLRDHRVELWLPIAYDVAITPGAAEGSEHLAQLPREGMRKMNQTIWRSSSKVLGSSMALLSSLANQR